jgi:lipopolysaccharide transport system permease protein
MSGTLTSNPSGGFWRQRDLWWQFTVRTVEQRHRGSHLGIVWAVLNPLLMLAIYFVVFGKIFGGKLSPRPDETSVDFALAIFLGLTLFQLFAETLSATPGIIVNNPNLVKKVVFPLEILPLAHLGAFWFNTLINLGLLLLGAVFFGQGVSIAGLVWLPVILAPLVLLSIGAGWLFAALGVFFRDISQAMPFFSQILLYSSLVFIPLSKVQAYPWLYLILKWNPLLQTIALARSALLWDLPVSLDALAYTYAAGLAAFFFGRWAFMKLKPSFADVL